MVRMFYIDYLYYNGLQMPNPVFWVEDDKFFLKQEGRNILACLVCPEPYDGQPMADYAKDINEIDIKLETFVGLCSLISNSPTTFELLFGTHLHEGESFDFDYEFSNRKRRADRWLPTSFTTEEEQNKMKLNFQVFLERIRILYQRYLGLMVRHPFLYKALLKCNGGVVLKSKGQIDSMTNALISFIVSLESLMNPREQKFTSKLGKRGELLLRICGLQKGDVGKNLISMYQERGFLEHGTQISIKNNDILYLEIYNVCILVCFLILVENRRNDTDARKTIANELHLATTDTLKRLALQQEIQKEILQFKLSIPNIRNWQKEYDRLLTKYPQSIPVEKQVSN